MLLAICFCNRVIAQNTKGIHFQGIARSENGLIIAKKQITLRISVITDTVANNIEYQEIKSITTNVLGLFYTDIGVQEAGKIITIGNLDSIQWQESEKYLLVEIEPNNSLHFLKAGFEKINYVPFAFYATQAKTITTVLPITLGGTGVNNKVDLLKGLNLEKVNNTADTVKPISIPMNIALNEKLKKVDTVYLSNRINQKLNYSDTLKWYNKHKSEIKMMLREAMMNYGTNNPADLFGRNWDQDDPFVEDTNNKNLLAWFSFEETAREIADRLGYEI